MCEASCIGEDLLCAKMLQMFSNFSWLFPLKISSPVYWWITTI